jgi:catechol 2,3-dioxygenase-like lactoylglutathione lyase family enzyme
MPSSLVDSLAVVLLLTNDTERTAQFYREVLGLPLIEERHDGRHRHYAYRLGAVYLTIQPTGDLYPRNAPQPGDTTQLCFTTASMDGFRKHLAERQVQPLHEPLPFEHTTFITLRDPDGRSVRIMTPWGK